ncbi:MAG: MlaD family protein [Bacteroidales bacterium]
METHSQKYKIRLGLFVAGGLALFVLTIFIIGKQKNLFNPVFKLSTTFYNVSGLQVGNNIRFSGINVGTVDNIKIINDSTVRVDMLIRKEVHQFIKSDCSVAIGSEGLIGDRLLIISQGSSEAPLAKEGQQLASGEPVEMDDIVASFQVSAKHTEVVTQQLSEVLLKVNSGRGTLGRLIHDSAIAQDLKLTIGNLKNGSGKLDATIADTKEDISTILGSFQVTASNAQVSTQQIEDIMVSINSGKGIIGRLIYDTVTADNIDQTILNLKRSTKGLDENMEALKHNILLRRYFKNKAKEEEMLKNDSSTKVVETLK